MCARAKLCSFVLVRSFLFSRREEICPRYAMRPERAQERGASWSRNFVNPKYFFFVSLSLKNSFFSFSSSFLSFVSNQSCVLEICRINVSTFFITFFSISLLFCFLSTCVETFVLTKLVCFLSFFVSSSLRLCSLLVFERDFRGKEVSEREYGGIHLAFWEQ